MRQAKSMPQNNICVINGAMRPRGLDPCGQSMRGLARGLGDMASSRVDLVVGIWRIVRTCQEQINGSEDILSLHLVTCTAWRANPARFQTKLPSLGRSGGTSRLTSL